MHSILQPGVSWYSPALQITPSNRPSVAAHVPSFANTHDFWPFNGLTFPIGHGMHDANDSPATWSL